MSKRDRNPFLGDRLGEAYEKLSIPATSATAPANQLRAPFDDLVAACALAHQLGVLPTFMAGPLQVAQGDTEGKLGPEITDEEMLGIQRGLADVAAGRTKPLEQIQAELKVQAATANPEIRAPSSELVADDKTRSCKKTYCFSAGQIANIRNSLMPTVMGRELSPQQYYEIFAERLNVLIAALGYRYDSPNCGCQRCSQMDVVAAVRAALEFDGDWECREGKLWDIVNGLTGDATAKSAARCPNCDGLRVALQKLVAEFKDKADSPYPDDIDRTFAYCVDKLQDVIGVK